eukprot:TRINITY_DN14085_c0_g1_i4.p1 TRINITY_DN14085_c0_g1~~TRINITY_DN14085_c0_g1_i4.p1  ORF type:complete len:198 (+),score=31.44 TRINITY_DN14085_c0_g1_i4:467-1060(+)
MIAQLCPEAEWPPAYERCNRDTWERSYRKSPVPLHLSDLAGATSAEMMSAAVQEQVEYYFSEKNLKGDEYTTSLMDSDGFVLITDLLRYERLSMLATEPSLVVQAVQASKSIELNTGQTAVRRNPNHVEVPVPRPRSRARNNICFDFQKGKCTRGAGCQFSHEESAVEPARDKMCFDFQKGKCTRGAGCIFSHGDKA